MTTATRLFLLVLLQLLVTTMLGASGSSKKFNDHILSDGHKLRKTFSSDGHRHFFPHRASHTVLRSDLSSTTSGGGDADDSAMGSSLPANGDVTSNEFINNFRKQSSLLVTPSPGNDEGVRSSDCHRLGLLEASAAVFRRARRLDRNSFSDRDTETNNDKIQLFRELDTRFADNRTIVLCKLQPKMFSGRQHRVESLLADDSTLSRPDFDRMFRRWKDIHRRKYQPLAETEPEVVKQASFSDPTIAMKFFAKKNSTTGRTGEVDAKSKKSSDLLLTFDKHESGNEKRVSQPGLLASTSRIQRDHRVIATDSPSDSGSVFTDLRDESARQSVRRVRHHSAGHQHQRLHRHLHHHNTEHSIGGKRSSIVSDGTSDRAYFQCIAGRRFPVMNLIYLKHVETVMRSRGCWSADEERLADEVFNRSKDGSAEVSDSEKSYSPQMASEHDEIDITPTATFAKVEFVKNNDDRLRQRCELQVRYEACRHRHSRDLTRKGRRRKTGKAVSGSGRRGLPFSWSQQVSDIMNPANNISMIFY